MNLQNIPTKFLGTRLGSTSHVPFSHFSDILFHTSCSRKIVFSRGWTWLSNKPKKPSGPNCKLKRSVTVEAWFPVIFSGKYNIFFLCEGPGTRNKRSWEHYDLFCWVDRFKLICVLSSKIIRKDFMWFLNVTKTVAPFFLYAYTSILNNQNPHRNHTPVGSDLTGLA